MKTRLNLIQSISAKNIDSIIDLLSLGKHTNDYIDGMSPLELAVLKQKVEMAESFLDNSSSGDI